MSFKRVLHENGPIKCCPTCGVALMTAAELAHVTRVPHSTVHLRLRNAGVEPVTTEGARELYVPSQAIPVVLGHER